MSDLCKQAGESPRLRSRILVLLLVPSVLFSADITKTYQFAPPEVRDGKILMDRCFIASTFYGPSVPAYSIQLLIPVGHKVTSCSVRYGTPRLLAGTHVVKPVLPQTPKCRGPLPAGLSKALSAVYLKNAFFPTVESGNGEYAIQYKNGIPIFCANINPAQYNPVTQQVKYYDNVTVSIRTGPSADAPASYCTAAEKSELKTLVENPEAVAALPLSTAGPNDYEYLIVCRTEFASAFGEFINFNKRRGLRTKICTVDDAKALAGSDLQDKIRNLVIREHTNCRIKYLLIVSNDTLNNPNGVPHRGFWAKYYDHDVKPSTLNEDNNVPADMYYGCLNGDWKTDSTGAARSYGYWGTEDIPAEVYVGRFCVATAAQIANIINKTIKYSEQPVTTDAITSVMLAGEFLWDDYGVLCTGSKSLANLKGGPVTVNNFTTYGFPTGIWNFTEVSHEKTPNWPDLPWAIRDSLFYTGISRAKCSWVDHNGHSSTDFAVGTVTSVTSGFYRGGINPVLSDNSWKNCNGVASNYFFMTSGGCYNGSFDKFCPPGSGLPYTYSRVDCWTAVANRLTTGPVAVLGNSRFGMGDNDGTDGGSDRPIRWFHDALFNPAKKIHHAGQMLANTKESDAAKIVMAAVPSKDITLDVPYYGVLKYTNYELNLFGDPALSLWTATPQKLTLQPTLNGTTITFDTKGPYSWVALVGTNDSIFFAQQTGIDGICIINDPIVTQYIAAHPGTALRFKVKTHNYLPDSAAITISTGVLDHGRPAPAVTRVVKVKSNSLRIELAAGGPGVLKVSLYDARGALVRLLANRKLDKGSFSETMPLGPLGSGVYCCAVSFNGRQTVKQFTFAK